MADAVVFAKNKDAGPAATDWNRKQREQFRAITVIAVDGVDFMPYLKLLLPSDQPLVDRVVVVTDGDSGAGANRRDKINEEFEVHVDQGCLSVHVGETTLEAEMYGLAENEPLLRGAFEIQHPQSLEKWDAIASDIDTPAERATAFSQALKNKSLDLGKGDFAHVVAEMLVDSDPAANLTVPSYLEAAILAATIHAEPEEADGAT